MTGVAWFSKTQRTSIGMEDWRRRSWLVRGALALSLFSAARIGTEYIREDAQVPHFFLFLTAIMSSAWLSGTWPATIVAIASVPILSQAWPDQAHTCRLTDVVRLWTYILCVGFAIWLNARWQRAMVRLRDARDRMTHEAAACTAELAQANRFLEEQIAERQRVQGALDEQGTLLPPVTETAPSGVWIFDVVERRTICINHQIDSLHEISSPNIVADPIEALIVRVRQDEREAALAFFDRLGSQEPGAIDEVEFHFRLDETGPYYRVRSRGVVITRGPLGEPRQALVVSADVSEWGAEAQSLVQTISGSTHLHRMTTLGELAASLTHELSQPLTALAAGAAACVRWLEATPPQPGQAVVAARGVVEGSAYAVSLIDQMRDLVRPKPTTPSMLDLPQIVDTVLSLARHELETHGVDVVVTTPPDLPVVMGVPVRVQQVLLNLVSNAIDALGTIPPSGAAGATLHIDLSAQASDAVEIRVTDTGPGIPTEARARVLEPFYTTKASGLGMGLAISRTIVAQHGGQLSIESSPGGGASICFTLPSAGRNTAAPCDARKVGDDIS